MSVFFSFLSSESFSLNVNVLITKQN